MEINFVISFPIEFQVLRNLVHMEKSGSQISVLVCSYGFVFITAVVVFDVIVFDGDDIAAGEVYLI